jgi:hypothetical protein
MSNNLSGVVVGQYTDQCHLFTGMVYLCIFFLKIHDCFRQKCSQYTGLKKLIKHFFKQNKQTNKQRLVRVFFGFFFGFLYLFIYFVGGGWGNIRGNY